MFDSRCYYKQLMSSTPGNRHAEDACRLAVIALHKSYQASLLTTPAERGASTCRDDLEECRGDMDVIYEELESIKNE